MRHQIEMKESERIGQICMVLDAPVQHKTPEKIEELPRHRACRVPSLPHNHPASHPSGRCERLARRRRCVGACPAAGHLRCPPNRTPLRSAPAKSVDLFVLLAFRFSSAVTCAQPLAAMPARGLREIFSTRTRTLAEKFSRPRGGTPAPSCRRDSPLPAGQKNWRPPSRGRHRISGG
jgi:hypothetical protein